MSPMKYSSYPAPIARDVGHWSAHARMWHLTTTRQGDGHRAAEWGARLEQLESLAAARASRTIESGMSFFRLPERLREEAAALDPGSLLTPQASAESRQFIGHIAEYLEFLGLSSELQARACIVAPAQMSPAIVPPFPEPVCGDRDAVICCNLSEVPARVALRTDPALSPDEPGSDDPRTDSLAISLEMADCLIVPRASILGYVPDGQGEPTFWFECLIQNSNGIARSP